MNPLVIIGASGHGKVVADIALTSGRWEDVVFLDAQWPAQENCGPWKVIGKDRKPPYSVPMPFVVAIGNASLRLQLQQFYHELGWEAQTVIHPSASVSRYARIGAGTVICAQAVVGSFATIGECGIVNTAATLDHDCQIAEAVHLAPGAHIAGGVHIGARSWIGIGANVIQNLRLGPDIMVGAGSVVVGNLDAAGLYLGIPARRVVRKQT